ncbi:MAG: UPF0164 family protein, partial [Ignavibacteriaceae bacterium]
MKNKLIIITLSIVILTTSLFSQDSGTNVSKRGTTAASFLSIGQGPRAIGMGSAYVAISDDPSSLYWNPAGITKIEGASFMVDHTQWLADISYNFLAFTYNLGDFGTIGA